MLIHSDVLRPRPERGHWKASVCPPWRQKPTSERRRSTRGSSPQERERSSPQWLYDWAPKIGSVTKAARRRLGAAMRMEEAPPRCRGINTASGSRRLGRKGGTSGLCTQTPSACKRNTRYRQGPSSGAVPGDSRSAPAVTEGEPSARPPPMEHHGMPNCRATGLGLGWPAIARVKAREPRSSAACGPYLPHGGRHVAGAREEARHGAHARVHRERRPPQAGRKRTAATGDCAHR